jgi:N-acetylglucosaminyldiphosphoundecaprenol N-acetyl-beta-D-mannosaminyltransferase
LTRSRREKIDIMGVGVHPLTLEESAGVIAGWIEQAGRQAGSVESGRPPGVARQVVTLNPEMLMQARRDPAVWGLLNRGDLVVPDGHGILWAGKRLGSPFPERVTGIDLIQTLAARAVAAGWRLYLLGGAPGVAEAAAVNLQRQHPGLQVAGTGHGYFTGAELPAVLEHIRVAEPGLLLVGLGFPRQEYFIREHGRELGPLVAVGVGGSFDVLSGRLRRSPVWIQRLRLEWLYRVFQEPARWRRLLVLPRFVGLVLVQAGARSSKPEAGNAKGKG